MGNGMMIILSEGEVDEAIKILESEGIEAKKAGSVIGEQEIRIAAYDGSNLVF